VRPVTFQKTRFATFQPGPSSPAGHRTALHASGKPAKPTRTVTSARGGDPAGIAAVSHSSAFARRLRPLPRRPSAAVDGRTSAIDCMPASAHQTRNFTYGRGRGSPRMLVADGHSCLMVFLTHPPKARPANLRSHPYPRAQSRVPSPAGLSCLQPARPHPPEPIAACPAC
jgi:hypothetical protein